MAINVARHYQLGAAAWQKRSPCHKPAIWIVWQNTEKLSFLLGKLSSLSRFPNWLFRFLRLWIRLRFFPRHCCSVQHSHLLRESFLSMPLPSQQYHGSGDSLVMALALEDWLQLVQHASYS